MKLMQYEIAFSDGFLSAIQRLSDLFCGENVFKNFTKKQMEEFISKSFSLLLKDEANRDLIRNEKIRIVCDNDKSDKKNSMKNFRFEIMN